jgi:diguanylate cyclase (GGDEF)-like protein/PAS domain S-box-containing protein
MKTESYAEQRAFLDGGPEPIRGELQPADPLFLALGQSAHDIVYVLGADGAVCYVNPAWQRILGHRPDEVVGFRLGHFAPPEIEDRVNEVFDRVLFQGYPMEAVDLSLTTWDGEARHFSASAAVCRNAEGRMVGVVGMLRDTTERTMREAELEFVASHDPVTGLPNRTAFQDKLEEMLSRSGRRRGDRLWALLFLGLDRFKQINSNLGHDTGDELLKAVAARVRGCLRSTDFFCRPGGDEFTIILTDLIAEIDVARVARKILAAVETPFTVFGQSLETSVSIGISLYPADGRSAEALMKNADMALYAAKEEGSGYRFFTEEMNIRARHRMKIESRLRHALERQELTLYYQPLVDGNQRIIGVEALLRWNHPELGLLSPKEFIGIAEETGAILPIGRWALKTACRQVKKWQEQTGEDLFVAVNLSARQFRDEGLAAAVLATLRETGLPSRCLKLEVTESCVMEQPETAIRVMKALKEHHISFSIDDFGTGYSSFSYLKQFPIDALKIDRCFVKDSLSSRGDREIIRSMITMARSLRLDIIAEGVETAEQHRFLSSLNCGGMQGFFFGRPLPGGEWEAFFESLRRSRRAG